MINQLRFSGIASGMDTESIVKQLMTVQRAPLDKLLQQRQWQDWQRDAFREVNTKLLDMRTSMEKLRLQSTFQQSKLSSTDSAKIEVSSSGTPSLSNYTISQVELAKPAQPASVKFASTTFSDANGVVGEAFSFNIGNGTNSKLIEVAATDTINNVLSKINSHSSTTGVTASFSTGDKSIIFTSTTTGSNADIVISSATANNVLKIFDGSVKGTSPFGATIQGGVDLDPGSVTINGTQITTTSNTLTYDGLKLNLKADMASGTGTVIINKETDTDAIVNDIKKFVEKYNEVIESLNGKISEKQYRDFKPLTDEQKEAMKEKEIEKWEEKAKSGLLRNDSIIMNVLSKMRQSLGSSVSGVANSKFDTLSEIGITTSENYRDNGKLEINEDKLREAISNNLSDVRDLFTRTDSTTPASDTTATNTTKHNNSGIGWRLYDQLNATIKEITSKAGTVSSVETTSLIGKSIKQIDDRVLKIQQRLTDIENRYWKQFTAMEKAISQSNSQSSWLMQQFSGGM